MILKFEGEETRRILQAMASMKENPEFEVLRLWLEENMNRMAYEFCHDDVENRWREGALGCLKELLKNVDDSILSLKMYKQGIDRVNVGVL